MKSRRKLNTLIIRPEQQLQIAFYFFCCFMILTIFVIGYFAFSLNNTIQFIQYKYPIDLELTDYVKGSMQSFLIMLILSLLFFYMLAFLIWVRVSHRIFGPLIPIIKHIKELQNTNFDSRIQLRENDYMTELRDELNVLAEKLQPKK